MDFEVNDERSSESSSGSESDSDSSESNSPINKRDDEEHHLFAITVRDRKGWYNEANVGKLHSKLREHANTNAITRTGRGSREYTDCLWFALLLAMWVAMTVLGVISIQQGFINRFRKLLL